MGYDLATAERVRQILAVRQDVQEKRMVGGLSFLVDGTMCCGVTGTAVMIRVGRDGRDQALAEPHVRPMVFAGRPLAGFVCVEAEGIRTEDALAAWIGRATEFALSLPPSRTSRAGRLRRSGATRTAAD